MPRDSRTTQRDPSVRSSLQPSGSGGSFRPSGPAESAVERAFGLAAKLLGEVVVGGLIPAARLGAGLGVLDQDHVAQRCGCASLPAADGHSVLVHAVSLGEMRAAGVLAGALRMADPRLRILLSAGNQTALNEARRLAEADPGVVCVGLLPWDRLRTMRSYLSRLRPALVVLVEVELWPGLLAAAADLGIATALVSARVYPRDLGRYKIVAPLARRMLRSLAWIGARSAADAGRLKQLGAGDVDVAGDLKWDLPSVESTGRATKVFTLAAVSSWAPEEDLALSALAVLPRPARLILAPRHPQRAADLVARAQARGYSAVAIDSAAMCDRPEDVLVLATLGRLPEVLASGVDLAVLGGTFADRGGQTPIEAAAAGIPLLVGPSTGHIADLVDPLVAAGAVWRAGSTDLVEQVSRLAGDRGALLAAGQRGVAVVAAARCAERYARRLLELIATP